MNIEEAIKYIKNDIEIDKDTASWFENGNMTKKQIEESIDAYETLLTAYEKEKEKNKKAIKYCREKSTFQTFGDFELQNVLETYINRLKHRILDILEE